MKRPRLDDVEALPRHRLKLTFVGGSFHTVWLAKDIRRLPGLAPLKNPKGFEESRSIDPARFINESVRVEPGLS